MKKLKRVRNLVQKLEGQLSKLINYGFTRVPVYQYGLDCSTLSIYVHKKQKIVVKRPYLTHVNRQMGALPAFACPTEILHIPTTRVGGAERCVKGEFDFVFIQPLVDVSPDSRRAAHSILDEKNVNIADLKEDNCGFYRRKPVIFDW